MRHQIMLSSGKLFDFEHPDPAVIDINVIADALSKLCRFTGHSRRFYSVAEHSVLVSRLVPPQLSLLGLLHDATEAFVGDMSTPLKSIQPEYREVERRVARAVQRHFKLRPSRPQAALVKQADQMACAIEAARLMPGGPSVWKDLPEPIPFDDWRLGWEPEEARARFIEAYVETL